jgi:hypothetical protein
MSMKECDQYTDRLREICRGEAFGIPIDGENSTNAYRRMWNLPPLGTDIAQFKSPPNIMIRGINFAAAMTKWLTHGLPIRTQEQIDERLAICRACPNLVNDHCQLCGCACVEKQQLLNKLTIATEKCPINKWE